MTEPRTNFTQPNLPASVQRLLRIANERGTRTPHRRTDLGTRIIAAREPKLLRAATRVAAARTQVRPKLTFATSGTPAPSLSVQREQAPEPAADPALAARQAFQERYALSDAAYEWIRGDPEKALATSGAVSSGGSALLRKLTPEQERAHRIDELKRRGGSELGRGAEAGRAGYFAFSASRRREADSGAGGFDSGAGGRRGPAPAEIRPGRPGQ